MFSILKILACLLGFTSVASGCTYTRLFTNTSSYNVQIPNHSIYSKISTLNVIQLSSGVIDVSNRFTGSEFQLGGLTLTANPPMYCTQNCYLSFSASTQSIDTINLNGFAQETFAGSYLYVGMQDPDTQTSALLYLKKKFDGELSFVSGCVSDFTGCSGNALIQTPSTLYTSRTIFSLVWDVSTGYTWYADGNVIYKIPSTSTKAQLVFWMEATSVYDVDFGTSSCPIVGGRITNTVAIDYGTSSPYSNDPHILSNSAFSTVTENVLDVCFICLAGVFMFSRITSL
jgi:hypothetical protein